MPAKTEQYAHPCNTQLNLVQAELIAIFALPDKPENQLAICTHLEKIMIVANRGLALQISSAKDQPVDP